MDASKNGGQPPALTGPRAGQLVRTKGPLVLHLVRDVARIGSGKSKRFVEGKCGWAFFTEGVPTVVNGKPTILPIPMLRLIQNGADGSADVLVQTIPLHNILSIEAPHRRAIIDEAAPADLMPPGAK